MKTSFVVSFNIQNEIGYCQTMDASLWMNPLIKEKIIDKKLLPFNTHLILLLK